MKGKKGKKKWIIIGVVVLLALFGALGGGKDDAVQPDDSGSGYEQAVEQAEQQANTDAADQEDSADTADQEGAVDTEEDEASQSADASDANEDKADNDEEADDAPEGISPELKEFLDSYEAYMDEYCEFMKTYDQNDVMQIAKYASLMEKYYEFSEKAKAWEEEEMTDEESLYYLKVMNRVNEKLYETGIEID